MIPLGRLKRLPPWNRRQEDRELDEELQSIADLAAEDLGSPQAARKALGSLMLAKEDARAVSGWGWLEGVAADAAYGFRVLRRDKVFAAVMVVSLGLCIGANAAIFSLIDAVLVRMLPVREPERLVAFGTSNESYPAWQEYHARSARWMSGVLATRGPQARELDTGGGPFRGTVELVTGNYFDVLGVAARQGRTIMPDDDRRADPAPVAVVSDGFWRRQLGGGPVPGRTVRVQGLPLSIIGVAPAEFFGIELGRVPDLWAPLSLQPVVFPGRNWLDDRNTNFLWIVGRLQPGVTKEAAADGLNPVAVDVDVLHNGPPAKTGRPEQADRLILTPAEHGVSGLRWRFSRPLHLLFGMVAAGLLLGCVNAMSLQLARASERGREIATRLAVGAGRGRIVRQLLTESSMLAVAAAALGVLLCRPVVAAALSLVADSGEPVRVDAGVDAAVLGFSCALAFGVVLVCGVLPALHATRGELVPALRSDSRSATRDRSRRWLDRSLLSVQMALSVLLVAAGCLFAVSLRNLLRADAGLDRADLAMLEVDPQEAGYDGPRTTAMIRDLLQRIQALPGVRAASFSEIGAFAGRSATDLVHVSGAPPQRVGAYFDKVGPRFFGTMGTTLLAGRDFDDRDDAAAPRVAIVNETFARRFFADRNPLGETVYVGPDETAYEIVGLSRDARVYGLRESAQPMVYLPVLQSGGGRWSSRFVVRTDRPTKALARLLRQVVAQQDGHLPVVRITTVERLLEEMLDRERLVAFLADGLALLALVIAVAGIYGSLSFQVARRTNEVGVRMALGADRPAILSLVLREVALWCSAGVALGTAAALACGRIVGNLVFGVKPGDPLVLAASAAILVAVALAAAWAPAHRAASVDPTAALRHE